MLNRKLNSARRKTCLVWVGTFLEKKRLRPPRVPDLQRSTFALAWPWLPWSFARSANRSSARLNPTRILRWKKRKRTPEIGAPPSRTERGAKKNHPALLILHKKSTFCTFKCDFGAQVQRRCRRRRGATWSSLVVVFVKVSLLFFCCSLFSVSYSSLLFIYY